MCDPISIAGAALQGAGMASNSIAANQVQHATNAAEQQNAYLNNIQMQRATTANNHATAAYNGFQAGQEALGQKLGDVLAKASTGRASTQPNAMAPTNAQTQTEYSQAAAPVLAYGDQQAHALGGLRSFGDYLQNRNIQAGRQMQTAAQADDFMKGNSSVLGLELNQAQHAGDTASLIGSTAMGLGGLGVKAGLTGSWATTPDEYGTAYGSTLGSLFGGDPTKSQVAQAGYNAGLTGSFVKNPDGTKSWVVE